MQQDTTGTIIEDNYFYGEPQVAALLVSGPQTNLTIRNNVFNVYPTTYDHIIRFWTDQGAGISHNGIEILNNTIVSVPRHGGLIGFSPGTSIQDPQLTNVYIMNNIFDTDSNSKPIIYIGSIGSNPTVDLSTFTCNYNSYHSTSSAPFYVQGSNYSYSEWKTYLSNGGAPGADTQSLWGTVIFRDKPGKDFRLSVNDVSAKDNGVDLSSKGFSKDKVGLLRPKGLKWDIGAHELFPGPTNLKIIP
jgi:hypothetical protein